MTIIKTGVRIMFYKAKEKRLKTESTEFDYITFGSGDKTLIMIQGLNTRGIKGSAVMLAWMYRIFTKDYTVYLFDRRADIQDDITVADMAKDVAMAMDTLKIEKADVMGVSQGGMIAQYLAINRPDLVNKLVLAVTLSKNNSTVERVIENWISYIQQGNIKAMVYDMAVRMYSDEYIKRYTPFLPLLAILQKPKDPKRFINMAKACLTCNTYDDLEKIQGPVFVIGGKQDKVVGSTACQEIAEKLKCRIYMYENLGHAAYEEAKDFNKKVYDFLIES